MTAAPAEHPKAPLDMTVQYTDTFGQVVTVSGGDPAEIVRALEQVIGRNPFQQNGQSGDTEKTTQPASTDAAKQSADSEPEPEKTEEKPAPKKRGRPKKKAAEPEPEQEEKSEPEPEPEPEKAASEDKAPEDITIEDIRKRGEDLVAALGMQEARSWLSGRFQVTKLKALTESQFADAYAAMAEKIRAADDAAEAEGRARVWPKAEGQPTPQPNPSATAEDEDEDGEDD